MLELNRATSDRATSDGIFSDGASREAMVPLRGVTVQPVVFLKRLRRLLVLRYRAAQYLDPQDIHLLDRCIYTTYCDCREVGGEAEAKRLLDEARVGYQAAVRSEQA